MMSDSVTYKDAGVDLEKADRITGEISSLVRDTFSPRVLQEGPGFAGMFSLDYKESIFAREYRDPILLGATDGVGTKLKVAFMADRHDTIGRDLVAMCVNDLMVQGGEPLFFLDYISSGTLEQQVIEDVVAGIAAGCKKAGCALIGGETAEMPGFYATGEYDMAGFCTGVAERSRLITGSKIEPGDVILGFPSTGLHSNGYSLVRMVLLQEGDYDLEDEPPELNRPLGDELLEPTRIYAPAIRKLFNYYTEMMPVKGMAHITGGGLPDNIARVLPEYCDAILNPSTWETPAIFDLVQEEGGVQDLEMYRSFNMGIGLTLICDPYFQNAIPGHLEEIIPGIRTIGRIEKGGGTVFIDGILEKN